MKATACICSNNLHKTSFKCTARINYLGLSLFRPLVSIFYLFLEQRWWHFKFPELEYSHVFILFQYQSHLLIIVCTSKDKLQRKTANSTYQTRHSSWWAISNTCCCNVVVLQLMLRRRVNQKVSEVSRGLSALLLTETMHISDLRIWKKNTWCWRLWKRVDWWTDLNCVWESRWCIKVAALCVDTKFDFYMSTPLGFAPLIWL